MAPWLCGTFVLLSPQANAAPVTLTDAPETYTLSNGTLTATIDKHSGNLFSLQYKSTELLDANPRHPQAYWSHSAATPDNKDTTTTITIDPKSNAGQRAEVSVKGIAHGKQMGSGPGGSTICDIEIRWSLAADDSAIYTYSTFTHPKDYPSTQIGEARFCAKLNDDLFDWMTVDKTRNMLMPTASDWNHGQVMNMKEARLLTTGVLKGHVEHKYDYSANQFDVLAWGWSSTRHHLGLFFINPTIEYLSGGPTKLELSAHRDATFTDSLTAPAPQCLLNYWRGSHYGSGPLPLPEGEQWSKTIGPFAIYINQGDSPDAMWKDALERSTKETAAWPYPWVNHPDYPAKDQRSTVTGKIVLNDPQLTANDQPLTYLLVGLTAPDYQAPSFRGGTTTISWQTDPKHYQFWTRANSNGTFSIPNVRPGTYTLHAFATGILGEYSKPNITIPSPPGRGQGEGAPKDEVRATGQRDAPTSTQHSSLSTQHSSLSTQHSLDLGPLSWTPTRFGTQLWEIGVPDRSAAEFKNGDRASSWGLYLQYPKDFPNDVHYEIGKSDYHKDWNLMQVPRAAPDDTNGKGQGSATPWTITWTMDHAPKGKATLRLAFAGTEARSLDIAVNDQKVTTLTGFPNTSSIHRDSASSIYQQRDIPFPATLLKQGPNTLILTVPPGNIMSGIMYDYLRLELDESAKD